MSRASVSSSLCSSGMIISAPPVSANTEKQKESKMREILSSADGSEMAYVFLINYYLKETLISSHLPQDQESCWQYMYIFLCLAQHTLHVLALGERERVFQGVKSVKM